MRTGGDSDQIMNFRAKSRNGIGSKWTRQPIIKIKKKESMPVAAVIIRMILRGAGSLVVQVLCW